MCSIFGTISIIIDKLFTFRYYKIRVSTLIERITIPIVPFPVIFICRTLINYTSPSVENDQMNSVIVFKILDNKKLIDIVIVRGDDIWRLQGTLFIYPYGIRNDFFTANIKNFNIGILKFCSSERLEN